MLTEAPERWCQAMNDRNLRHGADVVCNREGLEWFSCREHVPKGVKAVPLRDWYIMHGLLEGSS